MSSLRGKITAGTSAIAILVVALACFSLYELRRMEERIAVGAAIGEFFDTALEIRRFEKNYFLYAQAADLAETQSFVARSRTLLKDNAALFRTLAGEARLAELDAALARYAARIEALAGSLPDEATAREIRQLGKEIVVAAETLAEAERKALQTKLDRHRQLLTASMIVVAVLVIVIGQHLTRRVGRTLKTMEDNMEAVAAGRLTRLDMPVEEREIASLTQAFNHVLSELQLRQGQLVRSEKLAALGTMLSGVAHELNNPLSNIGTSTQILAEEIESLAEEEKVGAGETASGGLPHRVETAYLRELIGQIDAETWRARHIVRSLLDYARDRAFQRSPVTLRALVEELVRLMRGRIAVGVRIHIEMAEGLSVPADRQRLQQLFINLLDNALHALGESGEIFIQAQKIASADARGALLFGQCPTTPESVEILVRDTGVGIPAEVLPRIFDPFFTTKEVGQGVGLGLFIVFEIVEEHGGCIAVDSSPGHGTTFRIYLPLEP